MALETPAADALYAQVVAKLSHMNTAEIRALVHAQLTRIDDRQLFEAISTDASRDDLVPLAARTIVRARISTRPPPLSHPTSK
jgi:hypothetical protein